MTVMNIKYISFYLYLFTLLIYRDILYKSDNRVFNRYFLIHKTVHFLHFRHVLVKYFLYIYISV